ncbi:HAMP domain-containing histidine kinase [Clostridium sp. P21]|uniref:histidine kinase n=1 Tax=Clostridium muellerianum TaxID=2716538 RepID=A0A7Y0HSK7_9CLOT|nr:HAMP domain-containing sensor histidine kinase [Clostridium muellerianum]NMM65928.1 HAMP domain-containing histidine kinase [Clostridium muellerianum]
MKKSGYKIIFNLYFKFFIGLLILISIFMGIVLYILNVNMYNESSYANWSSWPAYFTSNFYKKISFEEGKPKLTDSAVSQLKEYKLSFQIIDKNGDVTLEYNEPKGALKHYSPIDIVQLYKNGYSSGDYTMFVGSVNNRGEKWTYIIGFPAKISKIIMYVNYDKFAKIKFIILGLFILLILLVAVYGIWMNRTLSNITTSIKRLASNAYIPIKEEGMYKDLFYSLNLLDNKLKASEEERRRNQALREEWIANISHDLKTPLSPIKGYAEILTDFKYEVSLLDVKKYGEVILRNAENVESIVENLNFTYQLKNGMLPVNRSEENLVRLLKEVIINILNHPKYEERNIMFNCTEDRINFNFDNTLLRRAFTNLLYNSVIHNAPDTIIKVSVREDDKIYITIEDNGKGMIEEEVKKLFERYYRGTKSSISVKGSGLGMAIAKQIIEAHEGEINVKSKLSVGTIIYIEFPRKN